MTTIQIASSLRAQIEREARAAFPLECCGLIEGTRIGETIKANMLHSTRNATNEPDRFEVDPADQFRILREARVRGAEIVGCYHSHPNGRPAPSVHDRESAGEDGFVWLIVALTDRSNPDLGAFILRSDKFEPISLEPT